MTIRTDMLACFGAGAGSPQRGPLYLPNLTLWYDWHQERGTLPAAWHGWSLPDIARSLGVPAWVTVRPFRVDPGHVDIVTEEQGGDRVIRYHAPSGTLTERWTLGPDGDWWETEYPVKTQEDLAVAREILEARTLVLDTSEIEQVRAAVGDDGIVALELPRRPFSQVFLEWLGWSDGLLLFFDAQDAIEDLVALLEEQLQGLVAEIAGLPGEVVVSPDNLDGQFISPAFFRQHLAASYERSAATLHAQQKVLLAGTGGPIRRLLAPLAAAGVDGLEGICSAPQSDASLAEARQLAGPTFTLWGGIAQDVLLPPYHQDQFEAAVAQAALDAGADARAIIGVADRVPVAADLDRLQAIPELIERALRP